MEMNWALYEKRNLLRRVRQKWRATLLLVSPGENRERLCGGRSAGNIEGDFRSCDARQIRRRSTYADDHGRRNSAGDQMRSGGLMAKVAGLAIRAGFSAMIVPGGAANQRKYKQKRDQHGSELQRSNCAILLH
jgi:hypothetical protein